MEGNALNDIVIRKGVPSDAKSFMELDRICFPPIIAFDPGTFRYHLKDRKSINLAAQLREPSWAKGDVPTLHAMLQDY